MAFNVAFACIFLLLAVSDALANTGRNQNADENVAISSDRANPIRRVVTMLQNMMKKVEAEGKKEKELYEKFMCYCKSSGGALSQSIADNDAKIPQVQSDIEESEAKLKTTKQELAQHQEDRDAAKAAMAKATAMREKEYAAFAKESGELKTNINAMAKAIPAIEKGMSGGFLQTSTAAMVLRVAMNDPDLSDFDRQAVTAYLQGSSAFQEGYVPKSGQIVGISKTMKDDFDKDLAALVEQENAAKKSYDELMAAKTKEVEAHTQAIEHKTTLVGELSVNIINMKNDLTDSEQALIEDTKFLQDLEKNCGSKTKEMEERVKTRGQEIVAIQETIKILNDDDALELFKKTLPSASLIQIRKSMDQVKYKAMQLVKSLSRQRMTNRPGMDLIAVALSGKKVDFSKVIKMIDDMVALLAKEQTDDQHKKEYCEGQMDFADDKIKELGHSIADLDTMIADTEEIIKTATEEIKTLSDGIAALDKSVVEASVQRKKEHAEYQELMTMNTGAKQLIEFAKNRMQKFYNPKLYKPPPKRELTEEERISLNMGGTLAPTEAPGGIAGTGVSVSFIEIHSNVVKATKKDAPPPPPETFEGGYEKKSEESGGVLAMMDMLVKDLEKEMQEAEIEEKDAQGEYEQMMNDAAAKRADDTKSISEKESAKAGAEEDLVSATDEKKAKSDELMSTKEYMAQLHSECDWLLQNFELRKEARAEEVDNLKKAKAVLSGADFSLMQTATANLHKH